MDTLHADCMLCVLRCCGADDLARMRLVCRRTRDAVDRNALALWKQHAAALGLLEYPQWDARKLLAQLWRPVQRSEMHDVWLLDSDPVYPHIRTADIHVPEGKQRPNFRHYYQHRKHYVKRHIFMRMGQLWLCLFCSPTGRELPKFWTGVQSRHRFVFLVPLQRVDFISLQFGMHRSYFTGARPSTWVRLHLLCEGGEFLNSVAFLCAHQRHERLVADVNRVRKQGWVYALSPAQRSVRVQDLVLPHVYPREPPKPRPGARPVQQRDE